MVARESYFVLILYTRMIISESAATAVSRGAAGEKNRGTDGDHEG